MSFFSFSFFFFSRKKKSPFFFFAGKMSDYKYYRGRSGRYYCRHRSLQGGHVYRYPSNRYENSMNVQFSMPVHMPQLDVLRQLPGKRFKTDYKYEVNVDLVRISRRPNIDVYFDEEEFRRVKKRNVDAD